MKNTMAINLLKKELDSLTTEMLPKEQEIAKLLSELEEMKFVQNELIESIKQLGAKSVESHDLAATGSTDSNGNH